MFALLRQEVVILVVLALLVVGGSQLPKLVRTLTAERDIAGRDASDAKDRP
jgi:Sec-independent protein translocase protein TatA